MPAPRPPAVALRPADLRGWARLGIDAVVGVTDLVESMHATIARLAPPIGRSGPGRTRGLTGLVYRAVRGTTRLVGGGLDAALAALVREIAPGADSSRREAVVAAVNGIAGDHLEASGNPLAIPMRLRVGGVPIDASVGPPPGLGDGRRLLVMIHGLCMNDLQWARAGHDHGAALAREAGWTPLRLHYNTGRRVAASGRELAALLEGLLARWPVPVEAIAIVGHSMGGLVARAACDAAVAAGHRWPDRLSALVFLGTPHHGAPLERGGHLLERVLGLSPYAAPFARLGGARSAGITDLRHGAVRDDAPSARGARVAQVPLPAGVAAYAVAATRSPPQGSGRLAGDGLVPVASALGDHRDPRRALGIPEHHRLVIRSANHWDLLDRPEVTAQLVRWLAPAPRLVTRPGSAAARSRRAHRPATRGGPRRRAAS
jgi:hypothetical protein